MAKSGKKWRGQRNREAAGREGLTGEEALSHTEYIDLGVIFKILQRPPKLQDKCQTPQHTHPFVIAIE